MDMDMPRHNPVSGDRHRRYRALRLRRARARTSNHQTDIGAKMAGPQYIRLTAVRILQPKPKGHTVEMLHTVLQPPVTQLVPLPALFNCSQSDGRTEHDRGNM